MTQALYRKWRSQTFSQVVGQEHVTRTLTNALRSGRVGHAYLFTGPRGTGKTSTARILAKALNCLADQDERPCDECANCVALREGRLIDLIEIDAASNNSVDDVRDLREKVGFRPGEGRYKVYIIDEVHMLSTQAFNALLKTLEEPPPHARFVLATTEPHKIPATVLSRCQRFDFRRIPVPDIVAHLQTIAKEEGFEAEPAALRAIARGSEGCMRDAVSLLDQMTNYGSEQISLEQVQRVLGHSGGEAAAELVDALAERDPGQGLRILHALLNEGALLPEFAAQVVEYLRSLLLLKMAQEPALLDGRTGEEIERMGEQAKKMSAGQILFAVKRFRDAAQEARSSTQPLLPLELALVESIDGEVLAQPAPAEAAGQARRAEAPATHREPAVRKEGSPAAKEPVQDGATKDAPIEDAGEDDGDGVTLPSDTEAISHLRARWNDFLNAVRERSGLKQQAALRSVRDIAVGEQEVAFAFGGNTFARSMIAEAETGEEIARILSEFLGRTVSLSCQEGERAELSAGAGRTLSDAGEDGSPDPLLEYAVSELGAKVLEDKKEGD